MKNRNIQRDVYRRYIIRSCQLACVFTESEVYGKPKATDQLRIQLVANSSMGKTNVPEIIKYRPLDNNH